MAAVVAVVFVGELLVMSGLGRIVGWNGAVRLAFLDALVLALVIAPPVYFLVLRPLRKEYERRLDAERRAATASQLAVTDPLTAALNRRGVKAKLLEAMAHSERYGRPLTAAMLDIDGFKKVNDRCGHAVGDEVLQQFVSLVRASLRSPDSLGRYGGDEFLIVLPETSLAAARALTARIGEVLRRSDLVLEGGTLRLSASFGEAEFEPGESLEGLLARADRALYEAKGRAGPVPEAVAEGKVPVGSAPAGRDG